MLAAIDRVDMAEWIAAIKETIDQLATSSSKLADTKKRFEEQGAEDAS